ncbi:DUF3857 domain-containing protein [Aureispira anguillae]|uniref:DUF3857 domain-containing protein n=1 Tax=Aureispira anguillae TaxID=2864201 RepID=A0A915YEX9_9BACT|nr:DUF3857 domain-containing protein [Aureispira anguillae]BDS11885.1 DUF3857 domain-containing protein [Aureispira anguillae]
MNKLMFMLVLVFLAPNLIFANDYQKAWEAISNKDLKTAKKLLETAQKDPQYAVDAGLTLVLLESFEGHTESVSTSFSQFYNKTDNPNPYLYALWFYEGFVGEYGKKSKEQLKLLKRIQKDDNCNGTIKAASFYSEGMHYLKSNDFKNAKKRYAGIGGLRAWQFVGPFENTLGSGFDKQHAPINKPEQTAQFTSKGNYPIKWFTPPHIAPESWIFIRQHMNEYDAIVYAQTFVESDSDQEAYICAGLNGSMKLWVNDQLVVRQEKEVVTEMDTYNNKIQLKKGVNRILVQIGFSGNSANFMVRITDKNYQPIPNLKESVVYKNYPKVGGDISAKAMSLFSEDYFEAKIKEDPKNPINYILLSKAYTRAAKENQARATIDKGLALYPDNVLLRSQLINTYLVLENRTGVLKEIDWIKQNLPNNYYPLSVEVSELLQDEKYNEAEAVLKKIIEVYGENEFTYLNAIKLAKAQGETERLLSLIKESYKTYPENSTFVALQYQVEKERGKNASKVIQILEKYCEKTYDYQMAAGLIEEYKNQGNAEAIMNLLTKLQEGFPYETSFMRELALFHYLIQRYDRAIKYMSDAIDQGPYRADVWNGMGIIYEQKGETEKALEAYEKSLVYNTNQYDLRHKVNKLKNKAELTQYLPIEDEYEAIKNTVVTEDKKGRDWYYIFYKEDIILFPKGACEEYHSMSAKIVSKQGIDDWKSIRLPYDSYRQSIVIEHAEVIKDGGQKLDAERNRNVLVFTDLEVGDVVYIKYKIQNYTYGRFAQDFWDKYTFNAFVHTDYSQYCLLVPKGLEFEYHMQNSDLKPKIEEKGDYIRYLWSAKDLAPLESETWMPTINDVGMNLHISTIKDWKAVADWYSAISNTQAKIDFDLEELLKEILPKGITAYSELEKSKLIYNYIVKNINYSSIPFRQSAYVPQKPGKTFQTKLGDCKDVSTLFATLGRKAGLDINLVLVDTRDNGAQDLILPSLNFNHCIAKLNLPDGARYLELTNANLPFGAVPGSLLDAMILDIPQDMNNLSETPKLVALKDVIRTPNEIHRYKEVSVEGKDLKIVAKTTRVGTTTSYTRNTYLDLDKKRQRDNMTEAINSSFNNPVELEALSFEKLDELNDSLNYNYTYKVKNEVISIGDMQTFKIPFADLTISPEVFAKNERTHPIDYHIERDLQDEEMTVIIGKDQTFVEIPKNVSLECKGLKFELSYEKVAENKLLVRKSFSTVRKQFGTEDYEALKTFFNKIITLEGQFLAFKAKK